MPNSKIAHQYQSTWEVRELVKPKYAKTTAEMKHPIARKPASHRNIGRSGRGAEDIGRMMPNVRDDARPEARSAFLRRCRSHG